MFLITIPISSARHGETAQRMRPGRRLLPPYKVLLHNDSVHFLHDVIDALLKSVPVSLLEAEQITLRAHFEGHAVVMVCPREEAEYYTERLETAHLTVTMEPA